MMAQRLPKGFFSFTGFDIARVKTLDDAKFILRRFYDDLQNLAKYLNVEVTDIREDPDDLSVYLKKKGNGGLNLDTPTHDHSNDDNCGLLEMGVTDHGALDGLADDDHPQYLIYIGEQTDDDDLVDVDNDGGIVAPGDDDKPPSEQAVVDYVGSQIEGIIGLGSELVVNGGFGADTDWTKDYPQWTISGGKAVYNCTTLEAYFYIYTTAEMDLLPERLFWLSFDVSDYDFSSGGEDGIVVFYGNPINLDVEPPAYGEMRINKTAINDDGHYDFYFVAPKSSKFVGGIIGSSGEVADMKKQIMFRCGASLTGTNTLKIDNVSLKPVLILGKCW